MSKESIEPWDPRSPMDRYILDLTSFWETGKVPEGGSRLLNNGLQRQRENLEKNGLKMHYEILPRGLSVNGNRNRKWGDSVYSNTMEWRSCSLKKVISCGSKNLWKEKEKMTLYTTRTFAVNGHAVADRLYSCPKCGAVSRIRTLQEGCPYCGTRFKMTELFPRFTNFYFIRDYGRTKEELRGEILKNIFPMVGVAFLALLWSMFGKENSLGLTEKIVTLIFGSAFLGAFWGYLLTCIKIILNLFRDAGGAVKMLVNISGSGKRFARFMQKYSPDFSFEYFSDKVVSILKCILSADDISEVPYYVGAEPKIPLHQIVEFSFRGAVALKKCELRDGYCQVTVDVYMEDYYYRKNRIRRKKDVFRMTLSKRVDREIDYGFSIAAIQCRNCGGSFDASRQRSCPYCGTRYEIQDEDWVVTDLRLK